jgi:acetoin utilization deacetylase AcuC-like enzyme
MWATEKLAAVAAKHSNGRIVSMLEGGYDLTALARSVAVHVKTLMDVGT